MNKRSFVVDNIPEYEIEEICSQVEIALKEKIIVTYLSKGKLLQRRGASHIQSVSRYAPRMAKFREAVRLHCMNICILT